MSLTCSVAMICITRDISSGIFFWPVDRTISRLLLLACFFAADAYRAVPQTYDYTRPVLISLVRVYRPDLESEKSLRYSPSNCRRHFSHSLPDHPLTLDQGGVSSPPPQQRQAGGGKVRPRGRPGHKLTPTRSTCCQNQAITIS